MKDTVVKRAKKAVSAGRREALVKAKKSRKEQRQNKRKEQKAIENAYMKALKKSSPEKMLSVIAIILTVLPTVVGLFVKDDNGKK